jgi:DNA invertase Pin-like site-specific DNA recombinase
VIEAPQIQAISYLRTSSAANVGDDKDSGSRQREAIGAFAKRSGLDLVASYYDAAVSGSDALEARPGFAALLDFIEVKGISTVVVEDASRLARDLLTQELGIISLQQRGVRVLTSSGDDLTDTSDPMKVAMRQIAGAFSQLEKARLVDKLMKGRKKRRKLNNGRCEGRKSIYERDPQACQRAKQLAIASSATPSLREIANQLAQEGIVSTTMRPFTAKVVRTMLAS